jgi:CheY-like chemotaxis protein
MSRIESGKTRVEITDADLDDIMKGLHSIIGTQCEAKGIRYIVEDSVPVRRFKTDILKLNQILLNLLGNAVKFTPENGEIKLSVSLINQSAVSGQNPKTDDRAAGTEEDTSKQREQIELEFIVKDTGIGIRKDRLQKIFEPFEQEDESTIRQYGGTGLGLPISSSYIALLGGHMYIDSEPSIGTTFSFTIPITLIPSATPADTKSAGEKIDFTGRRILIAEDDELNMEIAQTLLEKSGFIAVGAENGRVAVDKFTASPPGYFDAILMDIRMPELDGLSAAAEIRACRHPDAKNIPIIALSANAFAEDVATSKQAGMNDHIIKPLDMRVLLGKLEEFLQNTEYRVQNTD